MSLPRNAFTKWEPKCFIEQSSTANRDAMIEALGCSTVLLVKVGPDASELGRGLMASSPLVAGRGTRPGASNASTFQTQQGDLRVVLNRLAGQREAKALAEAAPCVDEVPIELLKEPIFVVPIRKKEGPGEFGDNRVTLGRSGNQDIVLLHASVSKLHAWFETRADGVLCIADSGSKNHTTLEGDLVSDCPRPVHAGARLRLGSVNAVVCSADALLRAFRV